MKKKIRRFLETMYHVIVKSVFSVVGLLPKKELFFFESFHGRQYSDNPRAIYEYLRENYPEVECVWAIKKGFEKPLDDAGVPHVRRMGLKWMLTMPRAKYWIFNTRMPDWMKKTKGTTYVQTWHGTPLKRLGLDIERVKMPGTDTDTYRENFINESARWDYLISPNHYSTEIFKSAFEYQGKILEIGYPRNDLLWNLPNSAEVAKKIRKQLTITESQKVLLYAPTWRDNQFFKQGAYVYENHLPIEELLAENPDLVIVLRTHYLIANSIDVTQYAGRVIDCSKYPDIRDLYLISDILVTDYSSVMFDFAYTKRPMIFYMYDIEEYAEEIRGFYFDPRKTLPGPIVTDKTALLAATKNAVNKNTQVIFKDYQDFIDKFCIMGENSASQDLIDFLFKTHEGANN